MTRAEIYRLLEGDHPKYGDVLAKAILGLILASAVVLTLESMPQIRSDFKRALHVAEMLFVLLFLAEFLLRLTCAPEPRKYLFSFWGIIDFLASVPAILLLAPDLQSLRVIRLLRLLRVLKLLRIGNAYDRLVGALATIRDELIIVLIVSILALYLAAVGIYHFEHRAQPETFTSIPASLWWAVATLTTVGYGDVYPITIGGRIFTGFVLLIGLGIVALPAGLLTSALMTSRRNAATETSLKTEKPERGEL